MAEGREQETPSDHDPDQRDSRVLNRLRRAALDYLRLLNNPAVKIRFDIVEALLQDGAVRELRHLPNAFAMEKPLRYGG